MPGRHNDRMDDTLRHQIDLAAFPADVQVTHVPGPGVVLRATQGGRGLELQVTPDAQRIYGEGPALSAALAQLKQAAAQGLPEAHPDGSFERLVFIGD